MNTHLGIRLILQHRPHHRLRSAGGVFSFSRSVEREAALIFEESFKTAKPAATADNPRVWPPPVLNQPVCEEGVVFGQKKARLANCFGLELQRDPVFLSSQRVVFLYYMKAQPCCLSGQ